jgi:hypothetical protein
MAAKPTPGAFGYHWRDLYGGCYNVDWFDREDYNPMCHAIWVDENGEALDKKTVCHRIEAPKTMEGTGEPESDTRCASCESRVAKQELPRWMPSWVSSS